MSVRSAGCTGGLPSGIEMSRVFQRSVEADRLADCESAIEISHIDLVNNAVAGGWTEREVAAALFNLAQAHLDLLGNGTSAGASRSEVA